VNLSDVRLFKREAACDGKERFLTFALAERIAGRVGRRHKGHMRPQVYRCQCGSYHVGSTVGGR
jgi:hypothetical protein